MKNMIKIGRNEPCPCGSGKKYKKCCIDKETSIFEPLPSYRESLWSFEEVEAMSTEEIFYQLACFGIPLERDAFLQDVERYFLAEEISERWFQVYPVTAKGRNEDFPWLAAWVLWTRLAPKQNLSAEQMDTLIGTALASDEHDDRATCAERYLQVWDGIKYKCQGIECSLDFLEEKYAGMFFIHNVLQDLEMALDNAGWHDPLYLQKKIDYCQEFLALFPHEDDDTIHRKRRAIGECYGELGNYEQADAQFEQLVRDYPENPWGYLAWGDVYGFGEPVDKERAKSLYLKALDLTDNDEGALEVLRERLEDLA